LKQRLQPIVEKSNGRATLVGWCGEIPKLLMEHHVLICKAGGAIVQESIAARCPMIVNHIVPGQEMGNYLLLKNNNCCALANHPREIASLIDQAWSDGARQWKEWRANLEKFKTQDSSLKIADFLLKL
jgi:processive 1,2-diacylglycerol beta-glucosyltransferase